MTEILAEQTPPLLHGPSDKEKKYDRQLRLWAANGQQALEDSHILLINSGSGTVGVETLKNLVLPGIGKFTIYDTATVTPTDLGVNFFLDEDCLGKSRAESCTSLLQELNPDVKGEWWPKNEDETVEDLFKSSEIFTLIIYTHPVASYEEKFIHEYSTENKIPLISLQSVGFYSYFQIHLPGNFPIVDTHPDSTATTDLRLLEPWPALSEFVKEQTATIDSLDAHEHGHIPYLVLLLYYLEQWKKTHDGQSPKTYPEKTAFRKMVSEAARKDNPEGGEENYDEATAAVLKNITIPTLSSSVREVFEYSPNELEAESSFWIITEAVKKFYIKYSALPLPGSVPDMKAQSKIYVTLQNLYKQKAREDVAKVTSLIDSSKSPPTQEEIETYCKNAAFIKLIRGSQSTPDSIKTLADSELNAEFALSPTLIPIYLALLGSHHQSPTSETILAEIDKIVPGATDDERLVNAAEEVARAKGSELHNISSLVGGMVAQEIIKVVTKQYVPVDNCCVFDGVTSRSQSFQL